jgi:CRP-like cAMP-binding protein
MNVMLKPPLHCYDNYLLDALPLQERKALKSDLQLVQLGNQELLFTAGQRIDFVYFPVTAIVSLLHLAKADKWVEIAAIGSEGMIGVSVLTGGNSMPTSVMTQCPGSAYRVSVASLRECLVGSEALSRALLSYTQALLTQIALTVTCNRQHSVYQQLCRWLLLDIDRGATNELPIGPDGIAGLLGVHADRVAEAMQMMQDAGLVEMDGGRVKVLSRDRLERSGCGCYRQVKQEFDRLLPAGPMTEPVSAVSDFAGVSRSNDSM